MPAMWSCFWTHLVSSTPKKYVRCVVRFVGQLVMQFPVCQHFLLQNSSHSACAAIVKYQFKLSTISQAVALTKGWEGREQGKVGEV